MGVSIGVLLVWTVLNFFRVDIVGWFNNFSSLFQTASVLLVAAVLLSRASEWRSREFVFTEYYNDTGFEAKSYVGAIGLVAALFSFAGTVSVIYSIMLSLIN